MKRTMALLLAALTLFALTACAGPAARPDEAETAAAAGELHEGVPGSRIHIYEGLGHGAFEGKVKSAPFARTASRFAG